MKASALLTVFLFVGGVASAAPMIAFVDQSNGDFQITSVTEVEIGDELYNATFHYVSYDIFVTTVTNPFTFSNDVVEASAAISSTVNSLGVDASAATTWTRTIAVPCPDSNDVCGRLAVAEELNPLSYSRPFTLDPGQGVDSLGGDFAFVSFVVVPEPAGIILFCVGLLGFGWFRLRR